MESFQDFPNGYVAVLPEDYVEWDSECGEGGVKNMMIMEDIVTRLKAFMENEARSCSMVSGHFRPYCVPNI